MAAMDCKDASHDKMTALSGGPRGGTSPPDAVQLLVMGKRFVSFCIFYVL